MGETINEAAERLELVGPVTAVLECASPGTRPVAAQAAAAPACREEKWALTLSLQLAVQSAVKAMQHRYLGNPKNYRRFLAENAAYYLSTEARAPLRYLIQ